MSFIKNNKRALYTGAALIMTVLFLVSLHQTSPGIASLNVAGSRTTGNIRYVDFDSSSNNSSSTQQERILVLTPLKDAVPYLDRYFELLDRTTYPNEQLSLAFLVSDSTDGTLERLQELADRIQHGTRPFHDIQIFHKDFHFELEPLERHKFEMQPYRRSIMARSRNLLLASALDTQVRWVAWVDADVIEYPPTIFEDLMSIDEDIVVPNCMLYPSKDLVVDDWAYDKNNWRETPQSLAFQQSLDPDFVLAEGYKELETGRQLLVDMPLEFGLNYKVPLDGVGATFTLVKAHVHRLGANFPAFPYKHQVETEGFAKIAKDMGFSVYGVPGYLIYHIKND